MISAALDPQNTLLPPSTDALVQDVAALLLERHWLLATAESCTGGMVAAACTDLAGSSQWFERGFVTYSNAAKTQMLGVDTALIAAHGAVSQAVAHAMAAGAQQQAGVQVSVATTGIAGPTGGSASKPVGLVWFGWGLPDGVRTEQQVFSGNRAEVRQAATQHALQRLREYLQSSRSTANGFHA